MRISGAKAVVEALKGENVEVIFGIPGGSTIPFYDAIYEIGEKRGLRHILARHEQCAAHMADGYARVKGIPGVCTATSGPGATNLVTGIAVAYMDSSPMIAITGQVPRSMIGRDAFQEADIVGIATPITKYAFQMTRASEIPDTVKAAFMLANTNRKGPVLIDIPKDVFYEEVDYMEAENVRIGGYIVKSGEPHPYPIKRAVGLILESERPLIIAGGGVISSNASSELVKLAELIPAPVATTLMGKGSIPETHPLSLGMVGMHGKGEANLAAEEADLIIAVGMRFNDRTVGKLEKFGEKAKIIHIDIDPAEIGKNLGVEIPIVADARKALEAISERLLEVGVKKKENEWSRRIAELKEKFKDYYNNEEAKGALSPKRIMKILRSAIPDRSIVTTGVGQNQMWAALHFQVLEPRTFITSGGLGAMGFGFPASLGVKVACPDRPVYNIDGDGSFLMTEQDLATAVVEGIPTVTLVMDNRVLGMVRQWQCMFCDKRYSETDLGRVPDFVKLAEAYGAEGVRVETYEELETAVRRGANAEVPLVIDVPISPDEKVLPMVPPGKTLREVVWFG
ncbi:MAG: biosynthetic-type acetolactate synthase large subunit [Candidatus Verstraetearchaeota archaeon]|nr:biosynthetic-type acetolactate synthase large subunit [Candidatus Verstraetearchaeota archaeon]